MRHLRQPEPSTPPASPAACGVHEVTERGLYPYRCDRCGQCFCCAHALIGYRFWTCPDGQRVPTTPSAGVSVPPPSLASRIFRFF